MERRVSAAIVVAATAIFGLFLILLPPYFPTFDEAKYLGIGVDIWAGRGITTVFGNVFTSHAPAWPAIVALPQATLGIDALSVGRFLDAVCGISIIALTGALGWRIRPIVGAISAAGLLSLFYLHDLTRTARLDVPASALVLAYLLVAMLAFRRGSLRLAVVAGVVFAAGFLVKEIDLPFAPAPFLAAVLWTVPWRSLFRTGAAMLGVGSVLVAPWFLYYAEVSHRVYRLDAPAPVLIPLGLGVLALVLLGLAAPWLAERRPGRALERIVHRIGPDARVRRIAAWGLTLIWAAAQTYAYAKTARLSGTTFLGLDQLQLYAATWAGELRAVAFFGLTGVALAIVALVADRDLPGGARIRDLVIATICGFPLVLLVIAVGEPPRNYLANLAIVTVLAAAGWVWTVERMLRTKRPLLLVAGAAILGAAGGYVLASLGNVGPTRLGLAGAAVGAMVAIIVIVLDRRGRSVDGLVVPAIAIAVLVGGVGILAVHGANTLHPAGGEARAEAVATEVAWIRQNVPPGTTIAYGSFLGYETAYRIADDYRSVVIRARISVSDAAAPDALRWNAEPPADDWIAVDAAPRNVDQFAAYRATWLETSFKRTGATYWVYTTGIDTSSPSIEPALTTATGFEKVADFSFPVAGTAPLHTSIYRVDPSTVGFDVSRLVIAPDALERLVGLLATDGAAGKAAAGRLVPQVDVQPTGPEADAAMQALRELAGP